MSSDQKQPSQDKIGRHLMIIGTNFDADNIPVTSPHIASLAPCRGLAHCDHYPLCQTCERCFTMFGIVIVIVIVISAKSTNFTTNTRYHVESSVDEPHRLQQQVLVLVS